MQSLLSCVRACALIDIGRLLCEQFLLIGPVIVCYSGAVNSTRVCCSVSESWCVIIYGFCILSFLS